MRGVGRAITPAPVLDIDPATLTALEGAQDRRKALRFADWWSAHADVLGARDAFSCGRLLDGLADELAVTGLVAEEQQFLFAAARVRMPAMGDRQYLATLDAIVADRPTRERLTALDAIAREIADDA